MKRTLPILSIILFLAACTSNPKENTESEAVAPVEQQAPAYNTDTAGLAQFQQWKAKNELAKIEDYEQQVHYTAVTPVKKVKIVTPKHQTKPVPQSSTATEKESVPNNTTGHAGTESKEGAGTNSEKTEASEEAKASEKKGWSNAAKGAAIGAGTGAAAGAVIYKKNRAAGAVIGGVVGGAVGYGIGKNKDKKEGS